MQHSSILKAIQSLRRLAAASGLIVLCSALCLSLASTTAFAQVTYGSPITVISAFNYKNITTDATTVVKSGGGVLHTLCVNTPAATETITIYDNTAASGTKIATLTLFASTNPCFTYDINFATGLTIVSAVAAGDITVAFL